MVASPDSIRSACAALAKIEPRFAEMLATHGHPEPRLSERGPDTLLRTIVGQQVSVAAARSMWAKLTDRFGSPVDLEALSQASDEQLREAGLSRQKAGYARSLAALVLSGDLDLDKLPEDDEEAIARLIQVKGIGRWSAEIYLLFAEGRADAFPAGDLAVQIQLGRMMGRGDKPSEKEVRAWAECWSPYRGTAAILAWHCYNSTGTAL